MYIFIRSLGNPLSLINEGKNKYYFKHYLLSQMGLMWSGEKARA